MSRFNPLLRYTCLLAFSLVGLWVLLVLLFAFLPSTPYAWDPEPSEYMAAGNPITRVYNLDQWFPYYDTKENVRAAREKWRQFFAIDFQLSYQAASSQSHLTVGKYSLINLSNYWDRVDANARAHGELNASFVSETINIPAKLRDKDGINPSWFRQADACLLFWEIHRDTAQIPVRLRVSDRQIQIWPDADSWDEGDEPSPRVREPLLELCRPDGPGILRIESRFPQNESIRHSSPSRTFVLRKAIQSILVPTSLFVVHHFGFVGIGLFTILALLNLMFKLLAVYSLVVFACWIASGKPRFAPWAQSFWMTRHWVSRLPTLNQETAVWDSQEDDETSKERRPQPLRGPCDFFRSTNPLDDLFVTFEWTKGMVKPITFQRNQVESAEQTQVTGVTNDFKFNLSKRPSKHENDEQPDQSTDLEKGPL